MNGIPEPWGTLLALVLGPVGVVVTQSIAIFFLWKLFREATAAAAKAQDNVSTLSLAIKELTTEVKAWREAIKP